MNALFGRGGQGLGNIISGNRVGMRGQLSFTYSGITDHLICYSPLIICNIFWTILEANISMLSY